MNKIKLPSSVARKVNKVGFKLKKHSPELLVVGGVVGLVTSAVMACKATTKLDTILEKSNSDIEKTKKYVEDNGYTEEYTETDYKKDLTILYSKKGLQLAKLYAPAVFLGTVSVTAILAGHNILQKRNVAIAAAYASVDKSFKDYRSRVVEKFGEELDKELKYNIKTAEVEETVVNEKTGKEKKVTKPVQTVNPDDISEYAKFYDDGCTGWSKNPEFNLKFLRDQQKYANMLLKDKGHVFLNEVYDMLGIPRTAAGQLVGWIYDEKHPNGDNYIDFGIYDLYNTKKRDFVNGYEKTILLDFNVDGVIYNQI